MGISVIHDLTSVMRNDNEKLTIKNKLAMKNKFYKEYCMELIRLQKFLADSRDCIKKEM